MQSNRELQLVGLICRCSAALNRAAMRRLPAAQPSELWSADRRLHQYKLCRGMILEILTIYGFRDGTSIAHIAVTALCASFADILPKPLAPHLTPHELANLIEESP